MDVSDEVAQKAESRQASATKQVSSSLTTQQIVFIGAILIGLFFFVYVWKKIEPKQGLIIGAVCAVVVYLLYNKGQTGIIPLKEATAILNKELKYMQKETKQFPSGILKMRPHCKLKNFDYKPNRYHIGFMLIQWNELEKIFVGDVDPYTGNILGITEHPEGFDASDVPSHVQFIPTMSDWGYRYRDRHGYYTPPSRRY